MKKLASRWMWRQLQLRGLKELVICPEGLGSRGHDEELEEMGVEVGVGVPAVGGENAVPLVGNAAPGLNVEAGGILLQQVVAAAGVDTGVLQPPLLQQPAGHSQHNLGQHGPGQHMQSQHVSHDANQPGTQSSAGHNNHHGEALQLGATTSSSSRTIATSPRQQQQQHAAAGSHAQDAAALSSYSSSPTAAAAVAHAAAQAHAVHPQVQLQAQAVAVDIPELQPPWAHAPHDPNDYTGDHMGEMWTPEVLAAIKFAARLAPNLQSLTLKAHILAVDLGSEGLSFPPGKFDSVQEVNFNAQCIYQGPLHLQHLPALQRVTFGRLERGCNINPKTIHVNEGVQIHIAGQPNKLELLKMHPGEMRPPAWKSHAKAIHFVSQHGHCTRELQGVAAHTGQTSGQRCSHTVPLGQPLGPTHGYSSGQQVSSRQVQDSSTFDGSSQAHKSVAVNSSYHIGTYTTANNCTARSPSPFALLAGTAHPVVSEVSAGGATAANKLLPSSSTMTMGSRTLTGTSSLLTSSSFDAISARPQGSLPAGDLMRCSSSSSIASSSILSADETCSLDMGTDLGGMWGEKEGDHHLIYTYASWPLLFGCWCCLPRRLFYDVRPTVREYLGLLAGGFSCCAAACVTPACMAADSCVQGVKSVKLDCSGGNCGFVLSCGCCGVEMKTGCCRIPEP